MKTVKSENEKLEAELVELRDELEKRRAEDPMIRRIKRRLEEFEQDVNTRDSL